MADTIRIDLEIDDQSIDGLNRKLDKLKDQMVGVTDPDQFSKLTNEAAKYEREIKRINDSIGQMADSQDELSQMSSTMGSIGGSLASLDFKSASEGASRLASLSKQMTFGSAIKSLKQLGSTFANLGKALLTNPLFLLATVIGLIVIAIVKLLDEMGVLTVMLDALGELFDWLMKPIKALIQGLKDLTDWFGWTSFAADESAEKQRIAADKMKKAQARATEGMINDMGRQIQLMKDQGAEIELIEQKELELAETKMLNFKQEVILQKERLLMLRQLGLATDEEEQKFFDMNETLKDLQYDLASTRARITNARQEREEEDKEKSIERWKERKDRLEEIERNSAQTMMEIDRQREDIRIDMIEDEIKREEAKQLADLKRQQEDMDFTQLNAEAKLKWEEWYQEEEERIRNEAMDKEEERLDNEEKMRLDQRKEFLDSLQDQEEISLKKQRDKRLEQLQEYLESGAITEEEYRQAKIEAEEKLDEDLIKLKKKRADEEEQIEKEKTQREMEIRESQINGSLQLTQMLLQNVIDAAGESSGIAKAAGVAQTTIDTYSAAMAAYKSMAGIPVVGPGLGVAAAASAVAMGAMNVRKILSTPTPGSSSGGGGSVPQFTGGGGSQMNTDPTPNFNLFSSDGTPETNESQTNTTNSQTPIKAVVQWSDIQTTMDKDKQLKNKMQL